MLGFLLIIGLSAGYVASNNDLLSITSFSSFEQRMLVFDQFFSYIAYNPERLILGHGAQSSITNINEIIVIDQSTIDSGYFSFLWDFGLFFIIIFVFFHLYIFYKVSGIVKFDPARLFAMSSVFYILLLMVTQVLSTGKIFIIILTFYSYYIHSINNKWPLKV